MDIGLSFDDVLLIPQYSEIESRSHVNLRTKLTKNISLNIPIISSNMDTVTEDKMCIAMARCGGIGILHRYCSIEEQVEMVKKVKRAESFVINNPYIASKNDTIKEIKEKIKEFQISSYLILENQKLIGLLTNRDIHFRNDNEIVEKCMTPFDKLITTNNIEISLDDAKDIMLKNKIEKLPIVDSLCQLIGLICLKDILRIEQRPTASLDKKGRLLCGAAIGVKEKDIERAKKLVDAGADVLVIDIAHGDSIMCINMLKKCKELFNIDIIAGNISTVEGAKNLIDAGADGIKIGQGNGCFGAGTRILMANGTYKNIENVDIGDYVINMNGKPVKVINSFSTGIKKVIKIRTNCFYKDTYVTPDHQFWIGDLGTNKNPRNAIAKRLDKLAKTVPKTSKYKFKSIDECNKQNNFTLTPKNIEWKLQDSFTIDLAIYTDRANITKISIESDNGSNTINRLIKPSYDLGYLFGSYLGDGNINNISVCWNYGLNEIDICEKTISCIKNVFNFESKYTQKSNANIYTVYIYNKYISLLFKEFGKKQDKHLPDKYYCLNLDYINGIFDGLIDSDGCIGYEEKVSQKFRYVFNNTSVYLIELFNWCCQVMGNSYSNLKTKISTGTLKNINIENCKQGYRASIIRSNRFTKDYIFSYILDKEGTFLEMPVFDLTVDCPTHTFIANGVIVHNSICSTRIVTGSGVPQFTALNKIYELTKNYNIPIISDGGNRNYGNISKAIGIGADCVMLGRMIGGCDETPMPIIVKDSKKVKLIRGMAGISANLSNSKRQNIDKPNLKTFTPEGVEGYVPYSGTVSDILIQICNSIRSGMSYSGAKNIKDFHEKAKFIRITQNAYIESGIHDVIQI